MLPPPRGVSLPAHAERRSPFIEGIAQTLTTNRNRDFIEERWNSYNPKTLPDVGSNSDSDLEFNDLDSTSNGSGSEFNDSDSTPYDSDSTFNDSVSAFNDSDEDEDYHGGK